LDAQLTGFISAAQIRRLDTYRGRVYDIKADSNSCRRAWDRCDAAPRGRYACWAGRRSRAPLCHGCGRAVPPGQICSHGE